MNEREKRALIRFAKIAGAAVLPVLIASLQQESFDIRATAIAAGIAVLAALQKYLSWSEEVPA